MKHRFCAAALAAVLLLSAAPLSPAASAAFSDAEGTWAAEVIAKAEGYGLMNGYPDGTFGVGKELTRGEFVAVLCRMFGWDAGRALVFRLPRLSLGLLLCGDRPGPRRDGRRRRLPSGGLYQPGGDGGHAGAGPGLRHAGPVPVRAGAAL